ncbi:helix-turn-helix domain-containing protein, partial [Candidatus Parcubacteria bacterium]|nr:helix-turn-helix domain-containing protein [Candidatus Parcubacteria bacterium]
GKDIIKFLVTLYHEKMWDDYLVDDSQEIHSASWIALQIGATKQELSPFIAQLLKAGVIKEEEGGEITVLDVERLKDFVFEIEI